MKIWAILLCAVIIGIGILSTACPGHVSVGVHVTGPYPPYGGPYFGPPVYIGRPYPGIW